MFLTYLLLPVFVAEFHGKQAVSQKPSIYFIYLFPPC